MTPHLTSAGLVRCLTYYLLTYLLTYLHTCTSAGQVRCLTYLLTTYLLACLLTYMYLRRAGEADRRLVVGCHVSVAGLMVASGHVAEYATLWLLPLATLFQQFLRLRSICEHGAVRAFDSPLSAARTNLGPRPLMWLCFPHSVNYHIEHHMHPTIPHYNLPLAHAELQRLGMLDEAEVCDVRDTLRLAFSQPLDPSKYPSPWAKR